MMTGYTPQPAELLAASPHADLRSELELFGQFIGSWDMQMQFFDAEGAVVLDQAGTWSFGWVLDGRCIQDVLIHPHQGSDRRGERGIGTTLRHYDSATGKWRVVWLGAVSGNVIVLTGGKVGDEIQLEGPDVDGSQLRWTFTDITRDSFQWTGFTNAGGAWWMEQQMAGRRRPSAPGDRS
jgi:hypothetical protein